MSKQTELALRLWPMVLGMLIILGFMKVEHYAFPVVEDFHISKMERKGDYVVMSGFMRKSRNCSFVGVSAELVQGKTALQIPLTYMDSTNHTATRPIGTQGWGPWQILIPAVTSNATVTLSATHKCHVWWTTQTHLANIPAKLL